MFFVKRGVFLVLTIIVAGLFSLPQSWSDAMFGKDSYFSTLEYKLGLDLVGGAQLEYDIDLTRVDKEDTMQVVSGIKNVIDQRVNKLGVTEPNVYTASV